MIRSAFTLFQKDIRLLLGRGSGLVQALLLGFLLIFLFSLSADMATPTTAKAAAAIFWMASAFCQVLIFNTLYSYEEGQGQRLGLLLGKTPPQAVWLGKGAAALVALLLVQALLLPAIAVFLRQGFVALWPEALLALMLANFGGVGLGSLLGALSQGQGAKESLLSIILFPLLLPLFLMGIFVFAAAFTGEHIGEVSAWLRLGAAFDGTFLGAAYLLFPYIYTAE